MRSTNFPIKYTLLPVFVFMLVFSASTPSALGADNTTERKINRVIEKAKSYIGTRHKLGGMTKRGIDCSGLMVVSFDAVGYQLPRVSRDQASTGSKISRSQIRKGDLVFFKQGSRVDHVGLVVEVRRGEVSFIHTSKSRGVMISQLSDSYWRRFYHSARRIFKGNLKKDNQQVIVEHKPSNQDHKTGTISSSTAVPGLYPEASLRRLTKAEVKAMKRKDIRMMKYEVMARKGYVFSSRKIQRYFDQQDWYQRIPKLKKKSNLKKQLSKTEKKNLKLLNRFE